MLFLLFSLGGENCKTVKLNFPFFQMKTEVLAEGQSRVIHLRSLPDDVTNQEIISLSSPFKKFGSVHDLMPLKVNKYYLNVFKNDITVVCFARDVV